MRLLFLTGRMYSADDDDGFQNMFVYQQTFHMIKYKDKNSEYIINWRSKGVYINKLLSNIKYFNKKIAVQFNISPLGITKTITNRKL